MSDPRPRILIADDQEQNRYVITRILERAGFACQAAATGREALELARQLPDVMILDVKLPDMSGYDVCRRIKTDKRLSQIAVLQISASFVSSQDTVLALETGADGYLKHPVDGVVLVATVRSLLRLREAEKSARESAVQWQSAFDALTEGLALVDAGGSLRHMNRAFAEICGLDPATLPESSAAEILETLLGKSQPLRYLPTGHYSAEFEARGKTYKLTIDPVVSDGDCVARVLVLADVTDRKLAEFALRTADQLAATGKLAHAIAHEINNPLEALTNLIYLAQTTAARPDVQGFLESASQELERIARITRQSLAFHRDTANAVAVNVGSVVADVVAIYEKFASPRSIDLHYDCQPTLAIYGFPGQLRQVFGNLMRNAIEASPHGCRVLVRVRRVSRRGREGVRVTIHDRGPGIPESVRRQIFDPFFTTKELKGSGLGLWVSKALVDKHAGTIRFRSTTRSQASGTTFEVFLPVAGLLPGAAGHSAAAPPSDASGLAS